MFNQCDKKCNSTLALIITVNTVTLFALFSHLKMLVVTVSKKYFLNQNISLIPAPSRLVFPPPQIT